MKKLLLSVLVASMFMPVLASAQTMQPSSTTAKAPKCNPAKSQPCGKACISLKKKCNKPAPKQ